MQGPLLLAHRKHSIKIIPSPLLFLALPFLDPKCDKHVSGSAKWQFQSVLCQGPLRFQLSPFRCLFLRSCRLMCFLCVALIAHCCHSGRRQAATDSVIAAGSAGLPPRLIGEDSSQPLRNLTPGQLYFKKGDALFTKRPFRKVSQQNLN